MEDHIKRRNHVAKMRSMLFRVDLKSKRIKKIKSKTYHRLKNKDLNKSGVGAFMDPEMAKEEAKKQEVRRVKVSLKFPLHCTKFSNQDTVKKKAIIFLFVHMLCAYMCRNV